MRGTHFLQLPKRFCNMAAYESSFKALQGSDLKALGTSKVAGSKLEGQTW